MSTNRGLFRLSLSEEVNYIIYNIYQKNEKYQIIHAVVRAEIAIGYVDGDALFPFRHEAVQEQRVVDGPAAAADLAFQFQGLLLIGVEQFGVIEQMTDECRFAVVDAAAGNKF